jgi:hypothetical protein
MKIGNINKTNFISWAMIFIGGVFLLLVMDEWLMSINNAEPFSLIPIVLGLLLYCVLEIVIIDRFKPVAWQIRVFFITGLVLLMLLNIGVLISGDDPFLFSDDRSYNEAAKAISQGYHVSIPLVYSGGYYYRFLGFLYSVIGPYTLNGRLVNFFALFVTALSGYKIVNLSGSGRGKYFIWLLLFCCPALVFFSLFEFKDMIFTAMVFVMLYFCKRAHCCEKRLSISKGIFFGLAVYLCYISWWFRVGVGVVFVLFNLIPIIINQRMKTKTVALAPAFFGLCSVSLVMANFTVFAELLPDSEKIVATKLIAYSESRLEKEQTSALQSYLIMKDTSDVFKAPVAVALIPFAPVNLFDSKDLLFFLFALFGTFSLVIHLGVLFAVIKGFKIARVDYYGVFLPTVICLIILTWFNAGSSRQFLFLIPFLILVACLSNIDIRKMMFNGFMLTLSLYALYYFMQLKEAFA